MQLRSPRTPRNKRRTAVMSATLLAVSLTLSSCGFEYATDRDYIPGAGTNNRDGDVDVLSAMVVSGQDGRGTFVAALVNGSEETASLTSIASADGSVSGAVTPVTIEPNTLVKLGETDTNIVVTGDIDGKPFRAGQFLDLVIEFDGAEPVAMQVPVMTNTGYYEGMDISGDAS